MCDGGEGEGEMEKASSPPSSHPSSEASNWVCEELVLANGNSVVLRKIEASLNLNLLRRRSSFPLPLEVRSLSPTLTVVDLRVRLKESADDFVNLPNLISMSRLISGPFLGCHHLGIEDFGLIVTWVIELL
ncbi:hypothetical protein EV1_018598 [Malus domestica]